jgi:hypothetical protein
VFRGYKSSYSRSYDPDANSSSVLMRRAHARLLGRREIISHRFSSSSPLYSLMEKSLPHTVQRMVTTRQPKWSTASLPQNLQVIRTSM